MCPNSEECPFYRCHKSSTDPVVKTLVAKFCHGKEEGCSQKVAKETYGTYLALNQTPQGTCLSN